tara:strand:- start:529 stop:747 length:219 start_codon:yes stop_codon:yes gene_type:complete
MNCFYCSTELEFHGHQDIKKHQDYYAQVGITNVKSDYSIVTNLSCPNCKAYVEIYKPTVSQREFREMRDGED